MMDIPTEILYKIWDFSGPASLYLSKSLLPYIVEKRLKFVDNPLRVYYRLCRWKSNYYGIPSKKSRASIYVEEPEYVDISQIPVGYVEDKNIFPSTTLCDHIIPIWRREKLQEPYSRMYWKVYKMWSLDPRVKEYSLLFPTITVELVSEML